MADHRFDLFARHSLQQAGGDGHQCRVLERAGRKGIGFTLVDADLGHLDAGLVGKLAHGVHDPRLVSIAGLVDDLHAHAHLGDGLAHQQRNKGTAHAHDEREAQQRAQVQAIGRQIAVHAKQVGNNAQHHHNGNVGQQKQGNAFHRQVLHEGVTVCGCNREKEIRSCSSKKGSVPKPPVRIRHMGTPPVFSTGWFCRDLLGCFSGVAAKNYGVIIEAKVLVIAPPAGHTQNRQGIERLARK
ncbi:hypothetical protein SDC9_60207 [bioreactor metagenome]|uniref:Uncharacterized protein n=1 Tax=bioreactor metagenome TaxID=1076179 RepID=A0A644XD71_9ZZZZ